MNKPIHQNRRNMSNEKDEVTSLNIIDQQMSLIFIHTKIRDKIFVMKVKVEY